MLCPVLSCFRLSTVPRGLTKSTLHLFTSLRCHSAGKRVIIAGQKKNMPEKELSDSIMLSKADLPHSSGLTFNRHDLGHRQASTGRGCHGTPPLPPTVKQGIWSGSNTPLMQGRHICAQSESERAANFPGVVPVGPCMCCLSFTSRHRRPGYRVHMYFYSAS